MDNDIKSKSINAGFVDAYVKTVFNKGIGNSGICSTSAETKGKTVTLGTTFSLVENATVIVTFLNGISVADATLNVSSSGAKDIYYRGAKLEADKVKEGDTVLLRYHETNSVGHWDIIGSLDESFSGSYNDLTDKPTIPAADEEDLTLENGLLKLKDREYALGGPMGKVILRKNMVNNVNTLTQSMISATNTIYVIQYDFNLEDNSQTKNFAYTNTAWINDEAYRYMAVTLPANSYIKLLSNTMFFLNSDRTKYVYDDCIAVTQATTVYITNKSGTSLNNAYKVGSFLSIPQGSILKFEGGSISGNSAIYGNDTQIVADDVEIFNGVYVCGTWVCPRIVSQWFGDLDVVDRIKHLFKFQNKNVSNHIIIAKGQYHVTAVYAYTVAINLTSNTHLTLHGDILLDPTKTGAYAIIGIISEVSNLNDRDHEVVVIEGRYNVTIDGDGSIVGDYGTHTGTNGEQGNCIELLYCNDVIIRGLKLRNGWGDGIYATGIVNTVISNCEIDGCRRQGITVHCCTNAVIESNVISNINGTNPKAAICFEPNDYEEDSYNLVIRNNKCLNCGMGLDIVPYRAYLTGLEIVNNHILNTTNNGNCGISIYSRESITLSNYHGRNLRIANNHVEGYRRAFISQYNENVTFENNSFILAELTLGTEQASEFQGLIKFNNYVTFRGNIYKHPISLRISDCKEVIVECNYISSLDTTTLIGDAYCLDMSDTGYNEGCRIGSNKLYGRVSLYGYNTVFENNVLDLKSIEIAAPLQINGTAIMVRSNHFKQSVMNRFISTVFLAGTWCEIVNNVFESVEGATDGVYITLNSVSSKNRVARNYYLNSLTTNVADAGTDNIVE